MEAASASAIDGEAAADEAATAKTDGGDDTEEGEHSGGEAGDDVAGAGLGAADEEATAPASGGASCQDDDDEPRQAHPDVVDVGGIPLSNPSHGVSKILKRVSRGELPRGFRRAQKVADLSQPPPRLRWEAAAEDAADSPARRLCHALMRLLFAPGLCVDDLSYALYHNKRRVLRERAATAADAGSGGRASERVLDEANAVWNTLLWAPGVGFQKTTVQATSAMLEARIELLRLMVSLLSKPLFADTDAEAPVSGRCSAPVLRPLNCADPRLLRCRLVCFCRLPLAVGGPFRRLSHCSGLSLRANAHLFPPQLRPRL